MAVPVGALFAAWCTLMAVAPVRSGGRFGVVSWLSGAFPNELPLHFLALVVLSTAPSALDGDVRWPTGWLELTIAVVTVLGLLVVSRRSLRTGRAVERAFADPGSSGRDHTGAVPPEGRRLPWLKILFTPWPLRPRGVERITDLRYGPAADSSNLLDVYRSRARPHAAPAFVYFHGGRFRWGHKHREARALLHRLASAGWVCVSANYRLSDTPIEGFPDHLIDVKRVIGWVRTVGLTYGADGASVVLAGSSAGAHLAAMAALTPNDRRFQPGFEALDTSVTAAVGLGGYYGRLGPDDDGPASSPCAHTGPHAPPFLVVHGDRDTYTPIEGARELVTRLRATSLRPTVLVELPGGQHAFDLFLSIRFAHVVDAVERFASWVSAQPVRSFTSGPIGPDVKDGS